MRQSLNQLFKPVLFCLVSLNYSSIVFAQSESSEQAAASSDIEEIVILGQSQNDAAMTAFRSGDFATAEIGFLKNAKCALRRQRSLDSLTQNQQIGSERAITLQNAQASDSGGNGSGPPSAGSLAQLGARNNAAVGSTDGSVQGGERKRAQENADYSCDNRGFQLYMAGLSQIQLGEPEKALDNFKSATALSKTLYDAHYRIGLISLLNEDIAQSQKQLKKIGSILKRCKKKCTVKDEIEMRYEHLKALIAKAST